MSLHDVQVIYLGQQLAVTYAGQAPMLVAGVSQVNFVLPSMAGNPTVNLYFKVGGWSSSPFEIWVK
jgi:uncharacterized protein (TIGR03437 family)